MDFLRFIEAGCVESSTNFTYIDLFPVMGLGAGGLKHAPLSFMRNRGPPIKVPAPYPPGGSLPEDLAPW